MWGRRRQQHLLGKENETKGWFLSIGDLGTVGSVRSDGSDAGYKGRALRSEGPACVGKLAASPVSEPLAEVELSNVVGGKIWGVVGTCRGFGVYRRW